MRIALTGGRSPLALFIAKQIKQQGHDVYMFEHISPTFATFSNHFKKVIILPSPALQWSHFKHELLLTLKEQRIDILLPINEETLYFAELQEEIHQLGIKFIISNSETLKMLHHKLHFIEWCEEIGIKVPKTTPYCGQQINFSESLVKPVFSRFGQSIFLNSEQFYLEKKEEEYLIQEKINGKQICVCICKVNNEVMMQAIYETNMGIENFASITYLSYNHEYLTQILLKMTINLPENGIFSFDFLFDGENFFPIECNPRLTFGVVIQIDKLLYALLGQRDNNTLKCNENNYCLKLLWTWKILSKREWRSTFQNCLQTKDVLANSFGIVTWLTLPWVLASYYLKGKKHSLTVTDYVVRDISYPRIMKGDNFRVDGC